MERVTVVVSCVSVCLSAHAILSVRAIKSITKETIVLSVRFAAILKKVFFFKLSYSKVRVFFTYQQSVIFVGCYLIATRSAVLYLGRSGHL